MIFDKTERNKIELTQVGRKYTVIQYSINELQIDIVFVETMYSIIILIGRMNVYYRLSGYKFILKKLFTLQMKLESERCS